MIRGDVPALKRDRHRNNIRDDTIRAANAKLVAAQSHIALANLWGGAEMTSADGLRFVVSVRTVHAGPNPKYFGIGRGVTWYNLLSDHFFGSNDITVPGTTRDMRKKTNLVRRAWCGINTRAFLKFTALQQAFFNFYWLNMSKL